MFLPRIFASHICMYDFARITSMYPRSHAAANSLLLQTCTCHYWVDGLTGKKSSKLIRLYSTKDKKPSAISKVKSDGVTSSTFEQVKENTKTVSYLGVIILGLGVTGVMFYTVLRELFSSKSPNNIYSSALERCRVEPRVLNALGEPIKGFGEETRRGRRRHVSHLYFQKNGINYIRMQFYIQGTRRHATVHLEMKEDDKGKFVYSYLIVKMDDYPQELIVLEDNRMDGPGNNDLSFTP